MLRGLTSPPVCGIHTYGVTQICVGFLTAFWQLWELRWLADRLLSIKQELSLSRNIETRWAGILSRSYGSYLAVILTQSQYSCVISPQNLIWVPKDTDISAFTCSRQVKSGPSKWAGMAGTSQRMTQGKLASCFIFLCSGYIEEACIIPCPSDCKLSEWSNWSRCSKSCGSGVKVRSKWLREKPYNGGRPCPKLDHVNQVFFFTTIKRVKIFLRFPRIFYAITSQRCTKLNNSSWKKKVWWILFS